MDIPERERLGRLQSEMHGDIQRLESRAGDLADVWTGIRMEGGDVVVLLTEPGPHEASLLAMVEHPDRVHIRRSPYSSVELDEVYDAVLSIVQSRPTGAFQSYGHGLERGSVALSSNQAELAAELHRRFGDRLEIELGRHRYPLDPTRVLPPDPPPSATIRLPQLTMTVVPDRDAFAPGEVIRGHISLHNQSGGTVHVSTAHPAIGVLLDDEGNVAGTHPGGFAARAGRITLEPGQRGTIHFVAGSDTRDPHLGTALPPGTYSLVITINAMRTSDDAFQDLITDPVPLRLELPTADSVLSH